MFRHLRKVMPDAILLIFTIAYTGFMSISFFFMYLAKGSGESLVELFHSQNVILATFATIYAIFRVYLFHPVFNSKYHLWLTLSPWNWQKPLLKGPIHLVWQDFAVLLWLTLLAVFVPAYYYNLMMALQFAIVPILAFGVVYIAMLTYALLATEMIGTVMVAVLLAPLGVFPYRNHFIALAVISLLYMHYMHAIKSWKKDFPWNSSFWKKSQTETLKETSSQIVKWPFSVLSPYQYGKLEMPFVLALYITIAVSWWVYCICWINRVEMEYNIVIFAGCVFSLIRMLVYVSNFAPPISLFARFATGRMIIPGYDKIFFAPLIVFVLVMLLPCFFSRVGLSQHIGGQITLFVVLLLSLSLPPRYDEWHFIGKHRIRKPSRSTQMNRNSAKTRPLAIPKR